MALVELQLPVRTGLRILRAVERIAAALERAYPDYAKVDAKPPEPGLVVVREEDVAEEQARRNLRRLGFKPDDVDAMIEEAHSGQ